MNKLGQLKKSPDKRLVAPEGQALLACFEGFGDLPLGEEIDPMLPWVVKEWKARNILLDEEGVLRAPGSKRDRRLPLGRYTHWFHSQHKTRVGFNIMQHDFAEVTGRVKSFYHDLREKARAEAEQKKRQGRVVYEFEDGWTVQQLTERAKLEWEGEKMAHCVGAGGYDGQVKQGTLLIYSLRSPKGTSHVTLDITPTFMRHRKEVERMEKNQAMFKKTKAWFKRSEWYPVPDLGTVNTISGKSGALTKKAHTERLCEWFMSMEDMTPSRMNGFGGPGGSLASTQALRDHYNQQGFADERDVYGLLVRRRCDYVKLFGELVHLDNGDFADAVEFIKEWASERDEFRKLQRAVYRLQENYRYRLGVEGEWEGSKFEPRIDRLVAAFELAAPDMNYTLRGVLGRARKRGGKSSLSSAWHELAEAMELVRRHNISLTEAEVRRAVYLEAKAAKKAEKKTKKEGRKDTKRSRRESSGSRPDQPSEREAILVGDEAPLGW